ncbi:glycosyltransferase 87 family protein [Corynebacterium bovis]|uniref:glycosyltransferase 87 family protein n=1 Tax=Corynebacterium bovis TaxID=36808 RepID=UPI000F6554F9|nr:glycosyltransferase 87 family protein [Corynebacterium bovis]RRO80930.1 alpha-mannosyltransferase [Corynebacterium bovis]RRO81885.1 alpha-mannosyltransferase [Corynebacterium bovis]
MSNPADQTSFDDRVGRATPTAATATATGSRAPRRRPASLTPPPYLTRLPLVVLFIAAVLLALRLTGFALDHARDRYLLDVGVFRDAGEAFLRDLPLYGPDFPSRSGFAFIYPPVAALLFVPLTWMSEEVMEAVWTVASVVAAWGVLAMAAQRLGIRWAPVAAVGLLGPALALEPVRSHLMYGQVNIFLILLVTADVLRFTPRWLRGVGIGVAAGIKITPAAYAIVFLARRDWAGLARSVVAFLATAVVGAVAAPGQSWFFWTSEFFASDRAGQPDYPLNQALTGLLARTGMGGEVAGRIMIVGLVVFAVCAVWAAVQFTRVDRPVTVLFMTVLAVSVSAPVAVTHHWCGIIVAVPLVLRTRDGLTFVAAALVIAANLVAPYTVYDASLPHFTFSASQWFLGNLQGLAGLVAFVLLMVAARRVGGGRRRPGRVGPWGTTPPAAGVRAAV